MVLRTAIPEQGPVREQRPTDMTPVFWGLRGLGLCWKSTHTPLPNALPDRSCRMKCLLFRAPQAIYRTLSDEPDGMVGLDVMRGAAGVPAAMKQRTWQHEHAEDWAGALEV